MWYYSRSHSCMSQYFNCVTVRFYCWTGFVRLTKVQDCETVISILMSNASQPQTLPNICPYNLLILVALLSPHTCRIHICWTLIVRLRQHAHNTDEDLLDALNRRPALRRLLVVVRVIAWRVQDRDADFAVGIHWCCQQRSQLNAQVM